MTIIQVRMRRHWRAAFLVLVLALFSAPAHGQKSWASEHWVGTWSASMQGQLNFMGRTMPTEEFDNQTVRMIVHATIGGHRARVRLSNVFGKEPLVVGAAHIAVRATAGAIVPASDRTLTFSGKPSITIPPGAFVLSDPVDLDVPQLGDLAISVYVPGKSGSPTWHFTGLHTTYVAGPGDFTGKTDIPDVSKEQSWFWIEGVDVTSPKGTSALVAFGDSITDGARSKVDANHSWPSDLAKRLLARPGHHQQLAVLNAGISGNRVLHDVVGPNALARFDRDALMQSGVKDIIVLESINDIGFSNIPSNANQAVSADDLIAGLQQLIERAHARRIRIFGATLTPFEGATYASPEGEAKREGINKWIRTSGAFDGVIDFDAAVRDPEHPKTVLPAYDSGDHLHPNDAGYQAMADAIDLSLFSTPAKKVGKHPPKGSKPVAE
jgi:lysophospholipase L1-like esterase